MQSQTLEGGFHDPALQSAGAFRAVMEAMARPATINRLEGATPPAPVSQAAGCAILTLCDTDTPIYLAGAFDSDEVRAWISFHTGAPFVASDCCAFALGRWEDLLPLHSFPVGTPQYPDRSATLIVEMETLSNQGYSLRGPGIRDMAHLSLPDSAAFQTNHAQFPLGLDFLFTCDRQIAALPRSTEVF